MLINFESFIQMLFVTWVVGEVLVQALKNKLNIDKMLYSIIVFVIVGAFTMVYNYFANPIIITPILIMNAIVYLILCVLVPITGYDTLIELVKRITK